MLQNFRLTSKVLFCFFTITMFLNETGTACSFFDWLFPTEVSPSRQSRTTRHVRTKSKSSENATVWIEVDGGVREVDAESMSESRYQAKSKPYWHLLKGKKGSGDYDVVLYNDKKMKRNEAIKLWFSSMMIDDDQTQSLIRDLHDDYHYKGYEDAFLSSVEESSEEYTKRINFLDSLDKKREEDLEKQREEYQYFNEFEATWKGQGYHYWLNNSQPPHDALMKDLQRASTDKRNREREAKKNTPLLSSSNETNRRKEEAKRREEEVRRREAARRIAEEDAAALQKARSRPYYYKGSHPSDGLAERVDFESNGVRTPRLHFPSWIPK